MSDTIIDPITKFFLLSGVAQVCCISAVMGFTHVALQAKFEADLEISDTDHCVRGKSPNEPLSSISNVKLIP